MFNLFAKTPHLAPLMRRVLIVDPQPATARLLGEIVREISICEIWSAASNVKAAKLVEKIEPDLIFCEVAGEAVDGVAFTRALRRSDLACRKAAVVMTTAQATAADILKGRDAGAHEFLRRPFTRKDVLRRIEAVLVQARSWVEAVDYVGPDRRRFNSAEFEGPSRRMADKDAPPQSVRIAEALKIVRSALAAIETDPAQARRALLAQAQATQAIAAEMSDVRLAVAAASLGRHLASGQPMDRAQTERAAADLLAYAGREGRLAA